MNNLLVLCLLFFPLYGMSQTNLRKGKNLVLLYSSEEGLREKIFKNFWLKMLDAESDDFDYVFLKKNRDMQGEAGVLSDKYLSDSPIRASLHSVLKNIGPQLDAYDYVIKVELDTILIFSRLKKILEKSPLEKLYLGNVSFKKFGDETIPYVHRECMVFSRDLAKLYLEQDSFGEDSKEEGCDEDWIFGRWMHIHDIRPVSIPSLRFNSYYKPIRFYKFLPEFIFEFNIQMTLREKSRYYYEKCLAEEILEIFS
jgi:hypothetical protein